MFKTGHSEVVPDNDDLCGPSGQCDPFSQGYPH